jgi:hypothetical protein
MDLPETYGSKESRFEASLYTRGCRPTFLPFAIKCPESRQETRPSRCLRESETDLTQRTTSYNFKMAIV